jgi:hypothetical protein
MYGSLSHRALWLGELLRRFRRLEHRTWSPGWGAYRLGLIAYSRVFGANERDLASSFSTLRPGRSCLSGLPFFSGARA